MRRILFAAASIMPLVAFGAAEANAQAGPGSGVTLSDRGAAAGGFQGGGGMRGPGVAPPAFGVIPRGGPALSGGPRRVIRPGVAPGWRGPGVRPGPAYGWRGPGPYRGRYYGRRGYYPYAGAAAGLALGVGALYPHYYEEPVYEAYPVPVPTGAIGRYCETPVKTCKLINVSTVGGGCSCKVTGGRSRGTVVP